MFVSAGDAGGATCDDGTNSVAQEGIAVNGLASTPYNVAVGGTDFMDTYDSHSGGPAESAYWNAKNTSTFGSARSYIPEIPWNDSCAGELLFSLSGFAEGYGGSGFCASSAGEPYLTIGAGGGGPSTFVSQPSWQTGVTGLPKQSGGQRVLPDVSLFAADGVWGHFYVFCMSDANQQGVPCKFTNTADVLASGAGGTSFAAPAMAGIQALVNQSRKAKQGNPNYAYYAIAATQYSTLGESSCDSDFGAPTSPTLPNAGCAFHDVTRGDTDVPCTGKNNCFGGAPYGALSTSSSSFAPAFAATAGWDFATGLGTANAAMLVSQWPAGTNGE